MKERYSKKEEEGSVEFTLDYDKHLFLAEPHGVINPSLVDEDLKRATEFSEKCDQSWTYCTNTQDVKLVNPFNILFLKEIKKLKRLKEIVVYAPTLGNRLLIWMVAPIFRPDRLIKKENEFKIFLQSVA